MVWGSERRTQTQRDQLIVSVVHEPNDWRRATTNKMLPQRVKTKQTVIITQRTHRYLAQQTLLRRAKWIRGWMLYSRRGTNQWPRVWGVVKVI